MRIGFLGTGGSTSRGQRLNTSLVVTVSGGTILIDCSGSPEQALARQGLMPGQISDLFLTHSHIDHVYALPSLLHSRRLNALPGSPPPLFIHGIPPVLDTVRALLQVFWSRYPLPLQPVLRPLVPPEVITRFDLKIEVFPIRHGQQPSVGYRIDHPRCKSEILFSGDAEPDPAIPARVNPDTILIHDCCGRTPQAHHTSADQLVELLRDHPPKRLFLIHLPYLSPGDLRKLKTFFSHHHLPGVTIPGDGDSVIL